MTNLTPYQKAALSLDKHIALTANAGSGKTFVFSKRFVKILIEQDIKLNQIIAITFTEKAASELYVKIAREIDEEIKNNTDNRSLFRRLVSLRNHIVSANISTIHSFCFNLLKEYSPVVGIDSNLTLIDTNLSAEIKEREILSFLDHNLNQNNPDEVKNLIRICGSKLSLQQQLKAGLNRIKIVKKLWDNFYSKDISKIVEHFDEQYDRLFNEVLKSRLSSALNAIYEINNDVLYDDETNTIAIEIASLLILIENRIDDVDSIQYFMKIKDQIFIKNNSLRSRGYLKKKVDNFTTHKNLLAEFFNIAANFNRNDKELSLNIPLAEFGKSYLSIVLEIYNAYEKYKTSNGFLDYEDLILISEKLLTNEEVRSTLASRYKFIMIDEYQDTDDTQFNIFAPILDNLKRGNLFVVGDEKQSIYMFRDADLRVFNRTKGLIEITSGSDGILQLPHSFRLSPKIAFFCNKIFSSLMQNPELTFNEVSYNELITTRDDTAAGEIEFLLSDNKNVMTEEELVSNKILDLTTTQNLCYSEIAVLVRKRSSFKSLEQQLLNSNIPYAIIGGRGFYEQQEIYDIHNYLQFLIDETNDAALIGILRSPFFLISDAELLRISIKNGDTFYEKLKLASEKQTKLLSIISCIEKHILLQSQVDIAKLIREILVDTNYLAVISAQQDSKQKIANINKLIHQAKHFHKKQLSGLYDFTQKLGELIKISEDEGQAQLTNDGNVVNLMTIHQSKGLEYKAVFLFNSHLRSNSETIKSRNITIDKDYGILTKLPLNGDFYSDFEAAPVVKIGGFKGSRQALAEVKRLMYVGMTRAEEYLYVSGDITKAVHSSSFLGLIKDALLIENFESKLKFNGNIEYMYESKNSYDIKDLYLDFNINVVNNSVLHLESQKEKLHTDIDINTLDIRLDELKSFESSEIVSATKMNMYIQCPLKYNLTYNLGYIDLHNNFNGNNSIIFEKQEDENKLPGNLKGTLFHKILERGFTEKNEIEQFLLNHIKKEQINTEIKIDIDSTMSELNQFFSSKVYREINQHINFKNEFEIYSKLQDFYIYGIIDKYYSNAGLKTIVDYKTDKVDESNYRSKFEYYRYQLLFYCLLINSYFGDDSDVEVKLIFISKPELSTSEVIRNSEIEGFRKKVISIVSKIRNSEFEKNLSHCNACQYSINNNCVIK